MANIFLPKTVILTDQVTQKLINEYGLSLDEVETVKFWNDEASPWTGTCIDTIEKRNFKIFPFDDSKDEFLNQYKGGKIFEL